MGDNDGNISLPLFPHIMLRDALRTDDRKDPVLERRVDPPELTVRNDDRLPIDESQRALVDAQWAVVERAFRRDLGGPVAGSAPPLAEPSALRSDAGPAPTPPVAAARVDRFPAAVGAPTGTPVEPVVRRRDPRSRLRWPWHREPSVAELKRIVKPKRSIGSAEVSPNKPGVAVTSLVAVSAAATVLAFWLMDRRFDGRPPAGPMASDASTRGTPAPTPQASPPSPPMTAMLVRPSQQGPTAQATEN